MKEFLSRCIEIIQLNFKDVFLLINVKTGKIGNSYMKEFLYQGKHGVLKNQLTDALINTSFYIFKRVKHNSVFKTRHRILI